MIAVSQAVAVLDPTEPVPIRSKAAKTAFDRLPKEYRYKPVFQGDNIIAAQVPWLATLDKVVRNNQVWRVSRYDTSDWLLLEQEYPIRFIRGFKTPIVQIGYVSTMSLSIFLRGVMEGRFVYIHG